VGQGVPVLVLGQQGDGVGGLAGVQDLVGSARRHQAPPPPQVAPLVEQDDPQLPVLAAGAVVRERRQLAVRRQEYFLQEVGLVGFLEAERTEALVQERRVQPDEALPGRRGVGAAQLLQQAGRRVLRVVRRAQRSRLVCGGRIGQPDIVPSERLTY